MKYTCIHVHQFCFIRFFPCQNRKLNWGFLVSICENCQLNCWKKKRLSVLSQFGLSVFLHTPKPISWRYPNLLNSTPRGFAIDCPPLLKFAKEQVRPLWSLWWVVEDSWPNTSWKQEELPLEHAQIICLPVYTFSF